MIYRSEYTSLFTVKGISSSGKDRMFMDSYLVRKSSFIDVELSSTNVAQFSNRENEFCKKWKN